MSAARDFRPLGLSIAVSATISLMVGCSRTSTPAPEALDPNSAQATYPNQFAVIDQGSQPVVQAGSSESDLASQEQILANLEDGRRFMESLQQASSDQKPLPQESDALILFDESAASSPKTDPVVSPVQALASAPAAPSAPDTESTSVLDSDPTSPLIRSLMQAASESDTPLKQHLALAVIFAWVAPEKPFEPQGLSELTDEERQLVEIVYQRFKLLGSELEDGADGSALASAFAEIITSIDAESPFQITRIKLCSAVRDYGDIDEFDPPMFSPPERSKFIWYVELDGADPRFDDSTGNYDHDFMVRTEMLSRETGVPVVPPVESTVRHASTSRIRDLFLRNVFEVPESLQYGWDTIKITVSEQQSGMQSQMGIDLLWVPSLAAGTEHFERRMTTAVAE